MNLKSGEIVNVYLPGGQLLGALTAHRVGGTAQLVATDRLQVLQLEMDLAITVVVQQSHERERRDIGRDAARRGGDLLDLGRPDGRDGHGVGAPCKTTTSPPFMTITGPRNASRSRNGSLRTAIRSASLPTRTVPLAG